MASLTAAFGKSAISISTLRSERMTHKPLLYTIGHSTHAITYFIELLSLHNVDCVIDVRSLAASRFNPQFNKKALNASLGEQGILYIHLPEAFGARQTDPGLLDAAGRVDFEKVRKSGKFAKGIETITQAVRDGHTIALMCSESDPLRCHRFSMISVALPDFDVKHILKDKTILTQEQLENILLQSSSDKLPAPDMFHSKISRGEQLNAAFKLLQKSIAYTPGSHKPGARK